MSNTQQRIDPTQQLIEKLLSRSLLPSALFLIVHSIAVLLHVSLLWLLLLHALFSILLAFVLAKNGAEWKHCASTLTAIGLIIGIVGGILTFGSTLSAITFFQLFTDPFLFAIVDALCAGTAALLFPPLMKLYQH